MKSLKNPTVRQKLLLNQTVNERDLISQNTIAESSKGIKFKISNLISYIAFCFVVFLVSVLYVFIKAFEQNTIPSLKFYSFGFILIFLVFGAYGLIASKKKISMINDKGYLITLISFWTTVLTLIITIVSQAS